MKKFFNLATIALAASAALAACNKEQPEEVKTIDPTGIVLISVPEQISAGDSIAICLRVNPSTALLTKENLTLDCLSAQVYDVQISESEKKYLGIGAETKAGIGTGSQVAEKTSIPYTRNTDNYSISSVVPDSLDSEALEGQYIVTIKAQNERNIIDRSSLALVCNFTDENGDAACVSSNTFTLTQFPQPVDAIFAWSPQSVSLHSGNINPTKDTCFIKNDTINAAKWYLYARTYKNAATGVTIQYDFDKYISSVKVRLERDSDEIACNQTNTDFDGVYSGMMNEMYAAIPDIANEPFKTLFEQGSDKKYETFTNQLIVTDIFGHSGIWSQDLNFVIPYQLIFRLDVPEDVVTGKYNVVDKFKTFSEYGIDAELMTRYPSLNTSSGEMTNMRGLNFFFSGRNREDGFGLDGVNAAGAASIKADLLCSRIYGYWYAKGPGSNLMSSSLTHYINIVERLEPAK